MRVRLSILTACSLVGFTTLLPSLADPDSDLPLHLQPLNNSGKISQKYAKGKHSLKKTHAKSRIVSTALLELHGKIPATNTL